MCETPPSPAVNGRHDGAVLRSVAAYHRPDPNLHVVEATDNLVKIGLPSGRISLQSSSNNDDKGNGNKRSPWLF